MHALNAERYALDTQKAQCAVALLIDWSAQVVFVFVFTGVWFVFTGVTWRDQLFFIVKYVVSMYSIFKEIILFLKFYEHA